MSDYDKWLERWPGYNQQSWPERFAELDRRSSAEMERRDKVLHAMEVASKSAIHTLTKERDMAVEALRAVDQQVSHGKLGDWSIALNAVRDCARAALSQLEASKGEG